MHVCSNTSCIIHRTTSGFRIVLPLNYIIDVHVLFILHSKLLNYLILTLSLAFYFAIIVTVGIFERIQQASLFFSGSAIQQAFIEEGTEEFKESCVGFKVYLAKQHWLINSSINQDEQPHEFVHLSHQCIPFYRFEVSPHPFDNTGENLSKSCCTLIRIHLIYNGVYVKP